MTAAMIFIFPGTYDLVCAFALQEKQTTFSVRGSNKVTGEQLQLTVSVRLMHSVLWQQVLVSLRLGPRP